MAKNEKEEVMIQILKMKTDRNVYNLDRAQLRNSNSKLGLIKLITKLKSCWIFNLACWTTKLTVLAGTINPMDPVESQGPIEPTHRDFLLNW